MIFVEADKIPGNTVVELKKLSDHAYQSGVDSVISELHVMNHMLMNSNAYQNYGTLVAMLRSEIQRVKDKFENNESD